MKNICKKLLLIPVLVAALALPVFALETNATDATTNQPVLSTNEDATVSNKAVQHHDNNDNKNGIHIHNSDGSEINLPSLPFSGGLGFGKTIVSLIAITSPFIFFIVIALIFYTFRYRRNKMLHETLRTMIEKGVAIPPELIVQPGRAARRRTRTDLRSGLIIIAVGIGLLITQVREGWILILVGIAFLITWVVEKKDKDNDVPPAIN